MGVIEDTIRSVPEERTYVGMLSIAAGLYATYIATQIPFTGFSLFGPLVVVLGVVLFTPHSHLIDSMIEPMLGAAGITIILPYAKIVINSGTPLPDIAAVSLLVFGALLLATSLVSLVYSEE
jgi:hypothetical protein